MNAFLRQTGVALLASAVVLLLATPSNAGPEQQATVKSLTGNWTCVTHASDGKTWRESDVSTMWGRWLKVSGTYAAQNGEPAGNDMTFFGYDDKHSRWIVSTVDVAGFYAINYSNSSAWAGSKWHDGYPNDGGSLTVSVSKNQYVIDGTGPNDRGKMVTWHQVCTRS